LLISDFKEKFESLPLDMTLTNREKQTLATYIEDGISPENYYNYEAEESLILNLYDKSLCFDKNFGFLMDTAPENKKLPKDAQNALALIKKNPLLLADHPNHFIINRDREHFPTVTCEKMSQLLLDSTTGDVKAMDILKRIRETLEQLERGSSHTENIKVIRTKYIDQSLDLGKKKTFN
jgi:hypothetical protein